MPCFNADLIYRWLIPELDCVMSGESYRLKHFVGDLVAGLTVGLTVIPQGIAYALVAELPPQVDNI